MHFDIWLLSDFKLHANYIRYLNTVCFYISFKHIESQMLTTILKAQEEMNIS